MSTDTILEKRLAAVENALADLKRQLQEIKGDNWIEKISGSFEDEPAFDEVLAYGKAIREGNESALDIER